MSIVTLPTCLKYNPSKRDLVNTSLPNLLLLVTSISAKDATHSLPQKPGDHP